MNEETSAPWYSVFALVATLCVSALAVTATLMLIVRLIHWGF